MITKLMVTIRIGTDMNTWNWAWNWTVLQLMTDTAILAEQQKLAEIREIMQRLDAKLEAIVNA
jgi:collagenase-like PrtC family protease